MDGSGLILHHSISLDSIIMHYGAVVTATKVLANNGDFVLVEHEEIKFCVLLACFSHVESGKEFCLVRHLQEQTDPVGEPILNEFECPLLLLTSCLYLVSTTCIVSPISIVHSSDSMCKFVECITNRVTERELFHLKN